MRKTNMIMLTLLLLAVFALPAFSATPIVGEVSQITLSVENTQELGYYGYVSCDVQLSDSSVRTDKSACMALPGNKATDVPVPVALTMSGEWRIKTCTVWADFATLINAANCNQAPKFFDQVADMPFTVNAATGTLRSPNPNAVLSGIVPIDVAEVSGDFDSMGWTYATSLDACRDVTAAALTNTTAGFTKNYVGTWDTTKVLDRNYMVCIIANMRGYKSVIASANVSTNNYRFTFNPVESGMAASARSVKTFVITLNNTGTATDQYVINCSAPADWPTTISVGGSNAACSPAQSLNVEASSGQALTVTVSTNVPAKAVGTQAALMFSASNSQGDRKVANELVTIGDFPNDGPRATNASTSPVSPRLNGPISFRVFLVDAEGDSITTARACANAQCEQAYCDLVKTATFWTCNGIANETGRKAWWIYAADSLGMSTRTEGSEFTVALPTVEDNKTDTKKNTTDGNYTQPDVCPYQCFASCESSQAYCVDRVSYGQRNCGPGLTCCRETSIPNCAQPTGCTIIIESADCIWDNVKFNYSLNVQARWSGGSYVRLSAAGVTSAPIGLKPALFNVRTESSGSKGITASVYSITDATLCTNTSTVTCVTPDQRAPRSPLSGALRIVAAKASSFVFGNEAGKAIDRDQFTSWQAQSGLPQWIWLDLGEIKTIGAVGIYTPNGKPRTFTIETSQNDATWNTISRVRDAKYSTDWNITTFAAVDAQYVRLNITAADGLVTAYEIEIYPGTLVYTTPVIPTAPTGGVNVMLVAVVVIVVLLGLLMIFRRRISLWMSYARG